MEFVPSGSLVAFSNLYRAGKVSEFPKEELLDVMIGMLVSIVAGLPHCGASFNTAGARASLLGLCSVNICYEQ